MNYLLKRILQRGLPRFNARRIFIFEHRLYSLNS